MSKFLFMIFFFIIVQNSFGQQLPTRPESVDFEKYESGLSYQNIPLIQKQFSTANSVQERDDIKRECQSWVFQEISTLSAPYFKVWCSYETDFVLRQFNIRGHILIKNW